MDGVLIDSEPYWQKAEIELFKKVGISLTKEMCLQTVGLRIDEVVHYWYVRHPWQGVSHKALEEETVERVIDYIKKFADPMPGVYETLEMLLKHNIPIALASSSRFKIIDTVLDKLAIRKYFKVVHSAELEQYGKPHPGIYLSTAQKLNIPPNECLAIEDSFNGLIAAKAARMKTIAVPEESLWHQSRFDIADFKIKTLRELTEDAIRNL